MLIRMARRTRVISLLALLTATGVAAQQPPPLQIPKGTSAIRGTVIDALSMEAAAGCLVRIGDSRYGRGASVYTGADGTFAFSNIVEGDYTLAAQCASHLTTCYKLPDDTLPCSAINLLKDQQRAGVEFLVKPGAVARGRVTNSGGVPIARAGVRAILQSLEPVFAMVLPATTDEDGRFELKNLPGGDWRIEVEIPAGGSIVRPPTVYYPGVTRIDDAINVAVVPGKVVENIAIVAPPFMENGLRVRLPPPDETMKDVVVRLIRPDPLIVKSIDLDAEGVGTAKGLIEGRYFVEAAARVLDQTWVAHEVVDFHDGIYDLPLQLQPAGRIRGSIVSEKGEPFVLSGVRVSAALMHDDVEVNPMAPDEADVSADASFQLDGMFGIRRIRLIGLDPQLTVVAVRQGRSNIEPDAIAIPPSGTVDLTIILGRR